MNPNTSNNLESLIQMNLNLNQPTPPVKKQQQHQSKQQQQQIDETQSKKKDQYIQSQKEKFKNFSSNKPGNIDSFADEIFKKMNQNQAKTYQISAQPEQQQVYALNVNQQPQVSHLHGQQQQTPAPNVYILPFWHQPAMLPLVYNQIFDAARVDNTSFEISTELLYPILLLSKIETKTLAKIWSLVNLTIPGRLVEHELYMAIALIGLAQRNIEINDINILYQLPDIPIPVFDFSEYGSQPHEQPQEQELLSIATSSLTSGSLNTSFNEKQDIFHSVATELVSFDSPAQSFPVESQQFQADFSLIHDAFDSEDKYSFFKEDKDDEDEEKIWSKATAAIQHTYESVYSMFSEFCLVNDDYEEECAAIVESPKGKQFFSCLYETYLINERIHKSSIANNLNLEQVNKLLEKNKEYFKNLLILLKITENDLKTSVNSGDMDENANSTTCCSLCLADIHDLTQQIAFSSNTYHNACINFWLNLVDELNFPNLKRKLN